MKKRVLALLSEAVSQEIQIRATPVIVYQTMSKINCIFHMKIVFSWQYEIRAFRSEGTNK